MEVSPWSLSSRLPTIAQLSSTNYFPSLSKSIHLRGTLVRLSARFWQDFTSFTSTVSPYSFASDRKVPSRCLTSISPAALVTAVARHFINATATLSHPHTGKWPTSFPQGFPEFDFLVSIRECHPFPRLASQELWLRLSLTPDPWKPNHSPENVVCATQELGLH